MKSMTDRYRIRVVFQGGGARLGTLLAAARAMELLDQTTNIKIDSIGGVSAGSIAAAALASSLNVDEVRDRLLGEAPEFIDLFDSRLGFLLSKRQAGLWANIRYFLLAPIKFPIFGFRFARIALNVLMGRPIVPIKKIEAHLAKVFRFSREHSSESKPFPIDLTVFSSLLESGEAEVYDKHHPDQLPIEKILSRSASIPFVLAGYNVENSEVDGGIVGNLPAPFFIDFGDNPIRVIVFTFEPEKRKITDVFSFMRAMLGSAMDASVREAVRQTSDAGGAAVHLPNNAETLDFESAIDELEKHRFEASAHQIKGSIEAALDQIYSFGEFQVIQANRKAGASIKRLYDAALARNPVLNQKVTRLFVQGEAVSAPHWASYTEDERYYVQEVAPQNDIIEVCSIGLPFDADTLRGLLVSVKDNTGAEVKFEGYIYREKKDDGTHSRFMIFLAEPIPQSRANLTIELKVRSNCFQPYRETGVDWSRTLNDSDATVALTDWIVVVANSNTHKITDLSEYEQTRDFRGMPPESAPPKVEDLKSWKVGHPFDSNQAQRSMLKYVDTGRLRDGIQVFGWRVEELEVGVRAGYVLERTDP